MKLTSEELQKIQVLASTGINTPVGTEWHTLREWGEMLRSGGKPMGEHKLRRLLTTHGEVFHGTERKPSGSINNQCWYKIDFSKL